MAHLAVNPSKQDQRANERTPLPFSNPKSRNDSQCKPLGTVKRLRSCGPGWTNVGMNSLTASSCCMTLPVPMRPQGVGPLNAVLRQEIFELPAYSLDLPPYNFHASVPLQKALKGLRSRRMTYCNGATAGLITFWKRLMRHEYVNITFNIATKAFSNSTQRWWSLCALLSKYYHSDTIQEHVLVSTCSMDGLDVICTQNSSQQARREHVKPWGK